MCCSNVLTANCGVSRSTGSSRFSAISQQDECEQRSGADEHHNRCEYYPERHALESGPGDGISPPYSSTGKQLPVAHKPPFDRPKPSIDRSLTSIEPRIGHIVTRFSREPTVQPTGCHRRLTRVAGTVAPLPGFLRVVPIRIERPTASRPIGVTPAASSTVLSGRGVDSRPGRRRPTGRFRRRRR